MGVIVVALVMACMAYAAVHAHPVLYDAAGYWRIADAYESEGWFASHRAAGWRTYLYPTVLVVVNRIADLVSAEPFRVLFALQFVAYIVSSALLARVLLRTRPRASLALFALLACNPFVLPYLASSLADAAALACFQAWLAAIIASRSDAGGRAALRWLAMAALAAGVACALRPAYVWLLALTPLLAPWRQGATPGHWLRVVLVLLLMVPPLLPQVAINRALFDRWTPLPVTDLARSQVRWGIGNLKYATAPADQGPVRMFYANPIAGDTLRVDQGVDWYLHNPLRGMATLAVKFVGAFDFDHVQPYAWDREPPLQWLWRALSLLLLTAGLRGMWLHVVRAQSHGVTLGGRVVPLVVLVGWAAVTLVTALELRFSLPMLSLLLPLAMIAVRDLRLRPGRTRTVLLASAGGAYLLLVLAARFIAAQNVLL